MKNFKVHDPTPEFALCLLLSQSFGKMGTDRILKHLPTSQSQMSLQHCTFLHHSRFTPRISLTLCQARLCQQLKHTASIVPQCQCTRHHTNKTVWGNAAFSYSRCRYSTVYTVYCIERVKKRWWSFHRILHRIR